MKLLMVDEDGEIIQEYADITAQLDGRDIGGFYGDVLKVVIPGESEFVDYYDDNGVKWNTSRKEYESMRAEETRQMWKRLADPGNVGESEQLDPGWSYRARKDRSDIPCTFDTDGIHCQCSTHRGP